MRTLAVKRALVILLVCTFAGCATQRTVTTTRADGPLIAAQTAPPPPPKKSIFSTLFGWTGVFGKIFPKKKRPPQAIPPQLIGEIKMVNKDDHFVLVDALAMQGARPGDALLCISSKRETAQLKVSAFKSPPFLIADIVDGTPAVGDKVFKQ